MNVLFISIAWPSSGERNLYSDLMDEFVLKGHKVYVAGTYSSDSQKGSMLSSENGMEVLRIHTGQIRKVSNIKKAMALLPLGKNLFKGIEKTFKGVNFDLIIFPTPPITLSPLLKRLKRKYNAYFYLLLKDIWPQGSVDHNVFRKYSLPWLYFRINEKRIYKSADTIGCMSELGAKYILSNNKSLSEKKVEVCPNSIRPNIDIKTDPSQEIRKKYNIPKDACVFLFSGNLGVGHGLHFLAEAIRTLSDYSKAYFVIGGSGTHFNFLKDKLDAFSAKNAFLYSWLPREDFNQILDTSDVGLILLYKYTSPQFPSRLLSYLEYSKPALCAINAETDMGSIVEDAGCGRSVLHGEMEAFIKEIKFFSENAEERKKMGQNGRKLLMEKYTTSTGYEIIMNHFQN